VAMFLTVSYDSCFHVHYEYHRFLLLMCNIVHCYANFINKTIDIMHLDDKSPPLEQEIVIRTNSVAFCRIQVKRRWWR